MDRQTQLAELGARRLAALTARRRALLCGNTRKTKQFTDDLRDITRQILAIGRRMEDEQESKGAR